VIIASLVSATITLMFLIRMPVTDSVVSAKSARDILQEIIVRGVKTGIMEMQST